MKTESTIGKLQSKATETQHYHRQPSVGNISESLQEWEADTTRVRQSKKNHVYAVSNDQGNLLKHYRYAAFGEQEIYSPQTQNKLAGSAIANPVLWNSRRFDEQTELYYYKYRHYNPRLGRDPIEENGGYNLYRFVENNSINRWDKLGIAVYIVKVNSEKVDGEMEDLINKAIANGSLVKEPYDSALHGIRGETSKTGATITIRFLGDELKQDKTLKEINEKIKEASSESICVSCYRKNNKVERIEIN